ncbi:MAG: glutamine-hydrolyzing GMP synthase, partial [Pseudomonadota bacterium]
MERILILDFGAQYTQMIARRIREAGVYCEILPCTVDDDAVRRFEPRGVILSGGPSSTTDEDSPRAPDAVFGLGVPILGICYGEQILCAQLGGKVEVGHEREFGRASIEVVAQCALFEDLFPVGSREQVWMSHGDKVVALPPGFRVVATSEGSPFAAIADDARRIYGVQFHPEVVHTPRGGELLARFAKLAGCAGTWTMAAFRQSEIARLREQIGDGRVICGLSGGVDSAVTALLLHEAIAEQLDCILVDTGLLRAGEVEQIADLFKSHYNIPLHVVDSAKLFLERLNGVTDPEQKRKIIGKTFIDVFEEEAKRLGGADFLAQGTLYPDVIESVSFKGPSVTIKSHHNVGGLPER